MEGTPPVIPDYAPPLSPFMETAPRTVPTEFFSFLQGKKPGRISGHTNAWVWNVLLYRVRNKRYPEGTPERMIAYYDNHEKMRDARRVVKMEKEGHHVNHQDFIGNKKTQRGGSSTSTPRSKTYAHGRPTVTPKLRLMDSEKRRNTR